jgi:lysozyme family protein
MTVVNFEAALNVVLQHEGGYVKHPADPGGATNRGITHRTLSAYLGRPASMAEVMALSRETAAKIYRQNYWNAIKADQLSSGLDLAVFDFAVNSGQRRAIRSVQQVLGVAADGIIGPTTLKAAQNANAVVAIDALCDARLAFLRGLSTWPVFGRGWTKRIEAVRSKARSMAEAHAAHPTPHPAIAVQLKEKTMMNDTKSILESRTVWANVVGLGAFALSFAGIDTGSIDQNALVNALLGVITGGSFIASTFFRMMAKHQIK